MKKITLFITLSLLMMGIQQTSAQTYDLLASFNGTGLEGAFGDATAVYATDPVGTDQVIKLTGNGTAVWQGLNVSLDTNYKLTAATQLSMQLDVYSTTAITIAPKSQGGVSGAPDSVTSATHSGSGWETLTFTFDKSLDGKVPANGDYSDFALHLNWDIANNFYGAPDGRIFYIKNLKGLAATAPVVANPTVAAPTPPARAAGNVISLFSDAYNNIGVSEWGTSWDSAVITDVTIAGNATKKIEYGDFIGIQLAAYTDLTSMTHFHMDYYINTGTDLTGRVLNPKFSNHAAQSGETNALLLTNLPTVTGSWVQVDVPLSSFLAQGPGTAYSREAISQLLIQSNIGIVHVDNIYLYNNNTLGTTQFEKSNLKVYPNPASTNVTIEANGAIERVSVFNILGQEVLSKSPKANNTTLDISNLQKGTYMLRTTSEGKTETTKVIKK